MLQRNDHIIEISRDDYLGNKINLADYRGKKVLLSFFRWASCPFCNLRIRQLIIQYPEFVKNKIEIIALFAATGGEISKYAGKQNAPFPIIPDPELDLYAKYGIKESFSGMVKVMLKPVELFKVMTSGFFNVKTIHKKSILPVDFLIGEDQLIYRAYYGKDYGDHIPIADVLAWKNERM